MSNVLGGKGTAYLGTNANQPPNWSFNDRAPTIYDTQNVSIGDLWLDQTNNSAFVLVSLQGNSTSKGPLATWVPWAGSGAVGILTLTGNDGIHVPGDVIATVNVVGAGPYEFAGDISTHTLKLSDNGTVARSFVTGSGTAIPSAGAINLTGTGGTTITGTGSTVTINSAIGATSFITSPATGTAMPTGAGVLTFAGSGSTTVSASGSTVTINSTGGGGTGILTVSGNSGGAVGPDGSNNINIVGDTTTVNIKGNALTNTLTASTTGAVATSFVTNPATGIAVPTAGQLTFQGGGSTTVSTSGSTVTINSTGGATSGTIVTKFTTSGTWTKNPNTQLVEIIMIGAGGGGGSGSRGSTNGTSNASCGGAGGVPTGGVYTQMPGLYWGASTTVTIGAGGVGGVGVLTDDTAGNPGGSGGLPSVGSIIAVSPGHGTSGGAGGQLTGNTFSISSYTGFSNFFNGSGLGVSGGGSYGSAPSLLPQALSTGAGSSSAGTGRDGVGISYLLAAGTGGGGGGSLAPTGSGTNNGGNGGVIRSAYNCEALYPGNGSLVLNGGTAGSSPGANGGNGIDADLTVGYMSGGSGGGGGAGVTLSANRPGSGGNGGYPGGGGGGGAGGIDGSIYASGAGGNGADSLILIIEHLGTFNVV